MSAAELRHEGVDFAFQRHRLMHENVPHLDGRIVDDQRVLTRDLAPSSRGYLSFKHLAQLGYMEYGLASRCGGMWPVTYQFEAPNT
jgi:hypothetical protein